MDEVILNDPAGRVFSVFCREGEGPRVKAILDKLVCVWEKEGIMDKETVRADSPSGRDDSMNLRELEILQLREARYELRRLCDEAEIALCHLGVSDDGKHEFSWLLSGLRDALARHKESA